MSRFSHHGNYMASFARHEQDAAAAAPIVQLARGTPVKVRLGSSDHPVRAEATYVRPNDLATFHWVKLADGSEQVVSLHEHNIDWPDGVRP